MNTTTTTALLLVLVAACGKSESATPPPPPSLPSASSQAPSPAPSPEATSGSGFEGELELIARSASKQAQVAPIKLTVKGGKLRFDVPQQWPLPPMLGQRVHVVLNAPARKLFAVLDDKRQVVLVDLDNLQKELEGMKPPGAEPARKETKQAAPKLTRTGHTDTVAGRSCEDWDLVSDKGEKARVCVADEGMAWFALPHLALPPEHAWASELLDGKHLPLRVIGYDRKGREEGRLEVSKLDKKPVDDALLDVPKDYATTDVATLMGSFMAGMLSGMPANGASPAPGANGTPAGIPPEMAEMIKKMQLRARKDSHE